MNSPITIIYNGRDAFSVAGTQQPTPFVALGEQTIYADEIWGKAESLTLQGNLTGCTYDAIVAAQTGLFASFNKSFQSLEIWQYVNGVSGKVFQKDLVEVNSINIDQGRWYGVQPYTINLTCYPSGLFSGAFGILNPQDNWVFAEQQNATLDVTHTISCQPFNTSNGPSNALDNARNWAFGRTGVNSWVYPALISGVSPSNFLLLTQNEMIDRFNGSYSLVETYTNDLARSGYGVIRYSADISSGNNLISVNLNGSVQGANRNLSGARAAYANIDWTAVALKQYQSAFNRTDLNPIPLTDSFNENPFTAEIGFNYAFDNSNLPSTWFDYQVNCDVGTNGFISANINGTVYARGGGMTNRLNRCKAYASGIDLYALTLPFYNGFDVSAQYAPLNPVPVSNGQTNNETNSTVELNATFNNRVQANVVLNSFNATINISPSLAQVDAKPTVRINGQGGMGDYSVVNLKYGSRATLSINGNAVTNRLFTAAQGEVAVRQAAYALFAQYGRMSNATLDQSIVTSSRTDDRVLSFTFIWSFGPTNIVGPTTVSSLAV